MFSNLPSELIALVGDALPQADTNALARSDKRLYSALNARLYRKAESSAVLAWAARHDSVRTIRRLLDAVAEPDLDAAPGGRAALSLAAEHGGVSVVGFLLCHGVVAHRRDGKGRTAMSYAAQNGYDAIVDKLVDAPELVRNAVRDQLVASPLYYAAREGNVVIVRRLLRKGVFTTSTESHHTSPLYAAVRGRHEDVVKLLLQDAEDTNGANVARAALFHAAEVGDASVVDLAMRTRLVGADCRDGWGLTPLMVAKKEGNDAVADALQRWGAERLVWR